MRLRKRIYSPWFILLLFIFLGLLLYSNSLNNSFHFDDEHHIQLNPHIRSLKNIPHFFSDPRTFSGEETETKIGGHYRPLLMVTHALNYAAGGLNPFGYHLVNLGFHIGSAYLLFLILQAMLFTFYHFHPHPPVHGMGQDAPDLAQGEGEKGGTPHPAPFLIALFAGLIFLVHPFNSEVINYITARSSVMSAFFYLLAFYFWGRYRGTPQSFPPRNPIMGERDREGMYFYYAASLLAFLLSLLTKEITATLPVMLLLYDLYFYRGFSGERWLVVLKKALVYLPFFFLVVLYSLLRKSLLGVVYTEKYGGYVNILNQIQGLARYLYLLIWPSPLSIEHDMRDVASVFQKEFIVALVSLLLILCAGVWLGLSGRLFRSASWPSSFLPLQGGRSFSAVREGHVISFFIFWYFFILLPMVPVPLQAPLQENRGYLAGVIFHVLVSMVIWGLSLLISVRIRKLQVVCLTLLISLIILYSTLTIKQNRIWRDDLTLWSDAVEKNPVSVRAYANLGRAYLKDGRLDIAEKSLLHALDMENTFRWIDYIHIRYDLASLYLKKKRFDLARENMEEAIRNAPDEPGFYVKLGNIYGAEKRWDEAEDAYKKALEIRPDYTEALARIGITFVIRERYREAIPYLMEAVEDKDYMKVDEVRMVLQKALEMVR